MSEENSTSDADAGNKSEETNKVDDTWKAKHDSLYEANGRIIKERDEAKKANSALTEENSRTKLENHYLRHAMENGITDLENTVNNFSFNDKGEIVGEILYKSREAPKKDESNKIPPIGSNNSSQNKNELPSFLR